ncbi:hypothetical protein ABB05_01160 [Lederbergia galactosidilytica]|uniref:Uncharacterized protein n=1 Tax=Lederbergia galactosidilytica TaxID=217031 RepID=A0A178A5V6_9BACI|nr:hypothetical protein ABB05_01160 [Lederbergia galactosidilytica]
MRNLEENARHSGVNAQLTGRMRNIQEEMRNLEENARHSGVNAQLTGRMRNIQEEMRNLRGECATFRRECATLCSKTLKFVNSTSELPI